MVILKMNTIKEEDFRNGWAKWMQKVKEIETRLLQRYAEYDDYDEKIVIPEFVQDSNSNQPIQSQ